MIKHFQQVKALKITTTYFAMIVSVGITWLTSSPFNTVSAASSSFNMKEIVNSHSQHISALYRVAQCLATPKNTKVLQKAIKNNDIKKVRSLQNICVTPADLQAMKTTPNISSMSSVTRNNVVGTRGVISDFYKSISFGAGPSAALIAGIALDGGLIWNTSGNGPIRGYNSTAIGIGSQINIGADPIIVGLYTSEVSVGTTLSSLHTVSAEAGPSVSVGIFTNGNRYEGIMLALGSGVGFNLGTGYKVKTKVQYSSCKNVTVKAHNLTGKDIKVIDVDFHHYATKTWHSKTTWNKKIVKGGTYEKTFNKLKDVGGDVMQIRVQYKIRTDNKLINRYTRVVRDWSKRQECHHGNTINVYLKNMS